MLELPQLLSERCPPTGGFAGSSVEKLLTQTSLRLPSLLVREAVQNSVDAALDGESSIGFDLRLRRLSAAQSGYLRSVLVPQSRAFGFEELYADVEWGDGEGPYVLEIADYNTRGLGGGIDPREAPEPGERTDFVDFVFKIGKTKDMRHEVGGGTFGFGKASSYMMSQAHTVVVHTSAKHDGIVEERLIIITLGKQFSRDKVMYTGRHWFGRLVQGAEGVIEPFRGPAAAAVAASLGLPDRGGKTGTTLCILAPRLDSVGDDGALSPEMRDLGVEARFVAALEEAVHYWCWPLFVRHPMARHPVVQFGLHVHGRNESARLRPRDGLFGSLMAQYRRLLAPAEAVGEGASVAQLRATVPVSEIKPLGLRIKLAPGYGRKTADVALGRVAVEDYTASPPKFVTGWTEALLEEPLGHIALMRPVGTVVCYRTVKMRGGATARAPFVGLCLASEAVHGLIADSEPPTHDDWNPENVGNLVGQRLVRRFLREIDEVAKKRFESQPAAAGTGATPAGVSAANFLGGLIGGEGRRTSTQPPLPPPERAGPKSAAPVVTGHELEILDGIRNLVFKVRQPKTDSGAWWRAKVYVVIDGKSEVDANEGFVEPPQVVGWEDAFGQFVASGASLGPDLRSAKGGSEYRVRVLVPRPYVVALRVEEESELLPQPGGRSTAGEQP